MATLMRAYGKKIYNMAMEFRGLVMEINTMEILCTGINLEKVNTSLQMVTSMKDNSIMVILMEGGN